MNKKKKSLIIANWKLNPTNLKEAKKLIESVREGINRIKENGFEAVICPPAVWLSALGSLIGASSRKSALIKLGAQNVFWESKGSFTGETSPLMLKDLGCQYVIIGHSERRKYFAEKDDQINQKIKAALRVGLKPILCVGENEKEKANDKDISLMVGDQVAKGLAGIPGSKLAEIVIAYEPVWAIGSGNPCSPHQAMEASLYVKKILTKNYNRKIAEKVRIIYGGSVDAKNAADYVKGVDMDGLLIGGSSLSAAEFLRIIENVKDN